MPKPHPESETREEFMARCVPIVLDDGTAEDGDQAVAICSSMWREATKEEKSMVINRAYALFNLKSVNEEKRQIEGIATTPSPDRSNDIVETDGIDFKLPLPLLRGHNSREPIGNVTHAKVTKDGITIKAQMAPQGVLGYVDEAWAQIKAGLTRGLSIGFRSIEDAFNRDTQGMHFIKTEWVELSVVTIPMNADATILSIKSADAETLAASGRERSAVAQTDQRKLAGVPAQQKKERMTVKDQIKQWEAKRAAHVARMEELMAKAGEAEVTLDAAQGEEYETLQADVEDIDKHLVRLRAHEKTLIAKAKPVTPENTDTPEKSRLVRGGQHITVSRVEPPKGINFARYAMAVLNGRGSQNDAADFAKRNWPDFPEIEAMCRDARLREYVLKAAIEPGTTTATTWAEPLVPNAQQMASEFLEMLRPATLVGRIPGLRRVPVNVEVPVQTGGGTFGWVGEKQAKPVTSLAFSSVTLRWNKIAGIIVLTKELVKYSNPSAEAIVRDSLIKDTALFMDQQFVDPTVAVNGIISPASITNGASNTPATGTTAAAFRTNMATALAAFLTANQDPREIVVLMSATVALNLSLLVNALGQSEFPGIGIEGGNILGMPVVVSQSVGNRIILVNTGEILINDDGGVEIDVSEQASVVMTDTPEASPAATSLVSLWQRNEIGLRVDRWVTWMRGRQTSVFYITNAVYSG